MTTEPNSRENRPEDGGDMDALHDRLTDQALRELHGERPPDLAARVLASADERGLFERPLADKSRAERTMKDDHSNKPTMRREHRKRKSWSWAVAAACLFVVGGTIAALLLPFNRSMPESTRSMSYIAAVRGNSAHDADGYVCRRAREPMDPSAVRGDWERWQFEKLSERPDRGQGPGMGGDQYDRISENPFARVIDRPLSTFSIDVDTASYANVRSYLLQYRTLPPPDAVRIEELINYFAYDYAGPADETPFAAHIEVASCPWQPEHRLARIAIKGKEIDRSTRPLSNLVFLVDVSGSMEPANKLPLLKQGMKLLAEQLGEDDQVAIVVYASAEGLVLPSTNGSQTPTIISALDQLEAGGSTNGGDGIELAYRVAQQNFIQGGVNRVILCTDGDFNVGVTSPAALERLAEQKAKSGVFLTVLGFGRGNLNDAMMENISNKGNGNYAYIDNLSEARKVLVEQMSGTLVTIAKDVKIQVKFNPAQVAAYRLIGYENRRLAAEDFNDDTKDAGEIGAGHAVTALYQLVPAGQHVGGPNIDPFKYQQPKSPTEAATSGELLTLKLRYKQPDGERSSLLEFAVNDDGKKFSQASTDFRFASSVAAFGMLLRGSKHSGNATLDAVLEIAESSTGHDQHGYRREFLEIVGAARELRR